MGSCHVETLRGNGSLATRTFHAATRNLKCNKSYCTERRKRRKAKQLCRDTTGTCLCAYRIRLWSVVAFLKSFLKVEIFWESRGHGLTGNAEPKTEKPSTPQSQSPAELGPKTLLEPFFGFLVSFFLFFLLFLFPYAFPLEKVRLFWVKVNPAPKVPAYLP